MAVRIYESLMAAADRTGVSVKTLRRKIASRRRCRSRGRCRSL